MTKSERLIAIDFDHTIVEGDKPLPGAREALRLLKEKGFHITIHSCNNPEWIKKVLDNNDIPYDRIWVAPGKPIAHAYVDDRAVHFDGSWTKALNEIHKVSLI